MTKEQLNTTLRELREGCEEEGFDEIMIMDIAADLLETDTQLRDAITKHHPNIKDQVGFLINQLTQKPPRTDMLEESNDTLHHDWFYEDDPMFGDDYGPGDELPF